MRRILVAMVALLPLYGCAQSHQLGQLSAPEEVQFKKWSADKVFSIALDDGRVLRGREVATTADSLSWYDEGRVYRYQVPADHVKYIEYHDAAAGAQKGFGVGFLLGGITGVALALKTGTDCGQNTGELCFDREAIAPFMGLTLGLITGLAGALSGAGHGVKHYYWIGPPGVVETDARSIGPGPGGESSAARASGRQGI